MEKSRLSCRLSYLCFLIFNYFAIRSTVSQGIEPPDAQFICYSSNECRGNAVSGIGVVENCCIAGGGLSYQTTSGQCANCYDQQSFTSEGSLFIFGIFDNHRPQAFEINRLRIAIDPVEGAGSSFTVESFGETIQYTGSQEISFKADEIQLNDPKSRDRGIRIQSLNGGQLSVVAYSEEFVSSDSFKVLPCVRLPNMGYEYYAVSVIQSQIEFQLFGPQSITLPPEGKSAIVIVTTEDSTILDITLTQDVFVGEANDLIAQIASDTIRAGETVTISLPKAMQTLYLASNNDLTGSRVLSNRPISFTSGHECGTLPNTLLYCDQMVDLIPSTSTWGKTFIVAALATRTSNDSVKIVASRNDTTISVRCSSSPSSQLSIGEAGGFIDMVLISGDSCYFESNNPVLLVQFSRSSLSDNVLNSDPFMVVIPPIEQYRSNYVIRTFATSDENSPAGVHYLNILLPGAYSPSLVYLDGQPIPETPFQSVICQDSETICAYTLQLPISEATHTLSHADPSARLNAVVYWYSFRVGQGYFAGMMQLPIALPTVTVEAVNNFANESDGQALFLLRRSGDIDLEASVVFETSNVQPPPNPARAGEDFQAVKMEVMFPSGVTEVMVDIPLIDDVFPEQEFKHFEVVLSASPDVLIGSPSFVNFTIIDDDPPLPVVNVSVQTSSLTTSELAGSIQVRLLKTNNAIGPVSVLVSTMDGTALSEDSDYVPVSEMVTFNPDELVKTVSVIINADLNIEDPEDFSVIVRPLNNADQPFPVRVSPNQGTANVIIEDEDVAVLGFTQSSYEFPEGSQGSVQVSLILRGGRQLQRTIRVMVSSVDGTATGGVDYNPVASVVEFSPGRALTMSVPVNVLADSTVEPPQAFSLRLTSVGNSSSDSVILSPLEALVTIIDRDGAIISLEPLRPLVREGDGSARVNVTLRGASYPFADVAITTSSLTATKGEDYDDPLVATVRLSEENSFEEVLIPIRDDRVFEGPSDEQFMVQISLLSCTSPGGLMIENPEAIVFIEDNDIRPVARVGFSSSSYSGVEGSQINLLVEGDGQNQQPLTVQYSVLRSGTAGIGIDVMVPTSGTLILPAGGSSTAAIAVSLVEDTIAETTEWFLIRVSVDSDEGEIISGVDIANVTILDNDRVIFGFESTEYSISEGQGLLEVNVLKLTEASEIATVRFSTRDVLVANSSSHVVRDEVLTFQPGESRKTVPITLVNDVVIGETVEIFNIRLTSELGQAIATVVQDGLAQVLVFDDDERPRPSAAVLEFSQSEYTALEGGEDVSACLTLVSLTGQLIENARVGFNVTLPGTQPTTVSRSVNLTQSLVGETIFCSSPIVTDDNILGDRRFGLLGFATVAGPDSITFTPGGDQATLTVVDNDEFIVAWVERMITVLEGDRQVELCLIVRSETVVQSPARFNVFTSSGEAQGGIDYQELNTVITFEPGSSTRVCAQVSIIDDDLPEARECFSVIATPQPDPLGRTIRVVAVNATVCIDDNDPQSSAAVLEFSQSEYTALEGEQVSVCIILVSLTGQLIENVQVAIVSDGPDVQSPLLDLNQTLVGEAIFCASLPLPDDNVVLGDQRSIILAAAAVPEPDSVTFTSGGDRANLTVVDNDEFIVGWEALMYTAPEEDGAVDVCLAVRTEVEIHTPARFELTTSPSEAQGGGVDYTEVDGEVLTFEPGQFRACTQVSIVDDRLLEPVECFFVSATPQMDGRSLTVDPDNTTVCIVDNDTSLIVLEFAESAYTAVEEGDAITVCIDLVSVTVPLVENVFVGFNSPGFRDNALRTFQSFVTLREADVGESIYCANVSYPFDSTLQGDQQLRIEAFATVDGSDMVSFTPGGDRADLMLIDATVIDVGFERAMYSTTEGDDSVEVCFTVGHEDSGIILDTTLMFRIFTTSGDALGNMDYQPFDAVFNKFGRFLTQCGQINITDDQISESTECFFVNSTFLPGENLRPSNIEYGATGPSSARVCIEDNDPLAGTIGFSQSNYTAMEGGEAITVCIVLLSQNGPLTGSALIGFSTFQGPLRGFRATGEVNFSGATVGDPLLCQNLTIQDDTIAEPDQVSLLSAFIEGPPFISYASGGDQASIIVIDNDASATIGFSQASYTTREGGGPVSICIVVVSLVNQLNEGVFVGFSDSEVVEDFGFNGARVGDEVLCQTIDIAEDNVVELDEARILSAFIEGSPSVTIAPGRDSAILNIIDNDQLVIGWEQVTYTVFEGDQNSEEICMVVESGNVLGSSAVLTIVDIPNTAQAGVDYTVSPDFVFEASSNRACVNVTIIDDQAVESVECFDLIAVNDANDTRISVRASRTTLCIVDTDFPPPITAQCVLNQTIGSNSASVTCMTSQVEPNTPIAFTTCEIDGTPSEICMYPSFTINTDNFQPRQHQLVLTLRVGSSLIRLMPDLSFNGTAPATTQPPSPRPTDPFLEPFLVSCMIDTPTLTTANVNCAATVGSSRVRIDSCRLDNSLSEICVFPSFSFSISNLVPGEHTLTITFSDANNPEATDVETLTFQGPEPS